MQISGIVQLDLFSPLAWNSTAPSLSAANPQVWIQISLCGSQLRPIPSCFFRDWIASELAVHEECDFVNVFLSSESSCSFGLADKIPCVLHASVEILEFSRFACLLGHMFCGFREVESVFCQIGKRHARRYVSCCIFLLQNLTLASVQHQLVL